MAAQSEHVCPQQKRGMMPLIIHDALQKGNVTEISQWLENGGDVNAADMSNKTFVIVACEKNYATLLKEVLKHPEVHINQSCDNQGSMGHFDMTPLHLACSKGHFECVEALLSSSSECQLDLRRLQEPVFNFISNEARRNNWRISEMVIEKGVLLHKSVIFGLIRNAMHFKKLDIVELLLQHAISTNVKLFHLLTEMYRSGMWTSECAGKLFKMAIEDNDEILNCLPVLKEAYDKRDWYTLETLLALLCSDSFKIDISLAEAVVGKAAAVLETMLAQQKLDNEVLNGALIVAAIGGTTEEIFERLFNQREHHSQKLLNYVLMLASQNNHLELFPTLFRNVTFSYSILVYANNYHRLHRSTQICLIGRALKKLTMETIPIPKSAKEEEE